MLSTTGRFRRADRILRNEDFKRVLKAGKRRVSEHFVVVLARQSDRDTRISTLGGPGSALGSREHSRPRLGVTVSKRVGNAVVRNHVKRLIREWFRRARTNLPERFDLVVIARETARDLSGTEMARLLDRAVLGLGAGSRDAAAVGTQ